jgi:hypothetical protein
MGKRQDFIDLYRSGKGTRQKYIDLSGHGFRSKSLAVPIDPFRELTIFDMLMSGALSSELKHGGIASLAPRRRYAQGIGPVGERQYNPVPEGTDWLHTMPVIDPNILKLMREYKKRQGLAKILEV